MKELKASEPLLLDGVLTPDAILKDPALSVGARLLWVLLGEYQGKVPECYPSQEMLAVPLGVKVRQFQSFIKELESYRRGDPPEPVPLVEVKLVFVEKDRKTRNIYNLLRWPLLAVDLKANGAERSHLADGGDAQYSAHRSEGEAQDAAAAPPALPSEDSGAVASGMPPSDTQSSAHQPEGATPDTVAGRRAIATAEGDAQYSAQRSGSDAQDAAPAPEDGGAVASGMPPTNAQSSAHRSDCGALDTASRRPELHWTEYADELARAKSMKSRQLRQQTQPQGNADTKSCAHQSEGATPDTVAGRRAMATAEGDAQYSAHRSEGEAQDATAAPPAMPSEDGGAGADGMPPSDAQSIACPGGDAQDTAAAALPEMLDKDGGLVPHGMSPSDTQSSAHRSGSDTQDLWTAPSATPGKDGGGTPDGMRDAQSAACQSEDPPGALPSLVEEFQSRTGAESPPAPLAPPSELTEDQERRLMVEYAKFHEAETIRLFDALPALVLRRLTDKKQNLLRQQGRLDRMALDVRRREVKNLIMADIEREQVMPFAEWVEPKRKSGTST
jgi:hypothetical protein